MSIELIACLLLAVIAYPVSKAVAIHYSTFAAVNMMFMGVQYADASLLAITFAFLAAADAFLFMRYGRKVLLVSAVAGAALSIESMINQDWLLNHSTYISIAVNAAIVLSLVKEFKAWIMGRYGRC